MNKKAVILTQLTRQLKAICLFLIVYAVGLSGFIVLKKYFPITFDFGNVTYVFIIYLSIVSLVILSNSLTFYTHHSYSRRVILNQTVVVQLIISLISSMLIQAHYALMEVLPTVSSRVVDDAVKHVYIDELVSNGLLRLILSSLLTTFVIFTVLQLINLFLILAYQKRRRNTLIVLVTLAFVIFGVIFSLPYWSPSMLAFGIKILGFVFGTGQDLLPSVIIPLVLLIVVSIVSYLLSLKFIKKLEVHKDIFI